VRFHLLSLHLLSLDLLSLRLLRRHLRHLRPRCVARVGLNESLNEVLNSHVFHGTSCVAAFTQDMHQMWFSASALVHKHRRRHCRDTSAQLAGSNTGSNY